MAVAQASLADVSICIDKNAMQMLVIDAHNSVTDAKGSAIDAQGLQACDTIAIFPISCGRGFGNKQKEGDMRTPEGSFRITGIVDSSDWGHDFHDGKGYIRHAYGPWFMRLSSGRGIGIHGTHDPASMGLRASEGCIRLRNEDLVRLKSLVKRGTRVEILCDKGTVIEMPPLALIDVEKNVNYQPEIIQIKQFEGYEKTIPTNDMHARGLHNVLARIMWWRR